MKKLLFLFFIPSFIYTQQVPSSVDPRGLTDGGSSWNYGLDFDTVLNEMVNNYKIKKDFDINKEPFLFKNWGGNLKIVTDKGNVYKLKSSNYHIDNDYIVSRISKDSIFIWDDKGIDYYLLNNLKFKRIDGRYFQVLVEGSKKSLHKRYFTKKIEKSYKDNPLAIPTKELSAIKIKMVYYLVDSKGVSSKVKLKRRTLLRSINEKDVVNVEKYAKENRLSFKKEKDVIKILNYYNKL